jgi:hypothetical protein
LRRLKSYTYWLAHAEIVRALITHALEIVLEWISFVLIAVIAIVVVLLSSVLYATIWFVRRLLEGL